MNYRPQDCRGFTMAELLIVMIILALLMSILIPVVGKIRESAKAAETAAWVQQLGGAIEAYQSDFRAYPGPLSNDQIRVPVNPTLPQFATGVTGFRNASGTAGRDKITMAENLVLGLLGGLTLQPGGVVYDPSLVGNGPMSLNPGAPKRFAPYIEPINLSWKEIDGQKTGEFFDDASVGGDASNPAGADDSYIPEFVDRYSDPMPILYLRAKVGSRISPNANGKNNNPVITANGNAQDGTFRGGQYDISQIIGYTNTTPAIGVGRKAPTYYVDGTQQPSPSFVHGLTDVITARTLGPVGGPGYTYPYDAFPYFRDPSLSNLRVSGGTGYDGPHVARQKDRFILISAGPDRIYGTNDDITNFGPVVP